MSQVLVVDDDKSLTLALSVRLRRAGFNVLTANSADEASMVALREQPELIILDIDMPHFTGFEFHQCLEFGARVKGTPVVYLSGHDNETNRREACAQGARAFVAKPYDATELVEIVRAALA